MRNAARAGISGLILIVIMLGGSLLLWIGVPAGWLYLGGRVEGATNSLGAGLAVAMLGAVVSIVASVAIRPPRVVLVGDAVSRWLTTNPQTPLENRRNPGRNRPRLGVLYVV